MPPVSLDPMPAVAAPAPPDSPALGTAPAVVAPVETPPAPVSPDSPPAPGPETAPPTDPTADQRIKDGQRKITEQAETIKLKQGEIDSLNHALATVLQHPAFQPVQVPTDPAAQDAGDWIKAYQSAPDDATALKILGDRVSQAEANGEARAIARLQREQARQVNATKTAAQQRYLSHAVTKVVESAFPDVPPPLFWSFKDQVHAETPFELQAPQLFPQRLQWQIERAVAYARAAMDPQRRRVAESAAAATALARSAGASMAAGSTPTGGAGAPGAAAGMAEQLNAFRTRMNL